MGGRLEIGIVVFERDVHVFQRRGGFSRWAHRKGQPVRLVHPVVGVLADYHDFDGVEGGVLRPFLDARRGAGDGEWE